MISLKIRFWREKEMLIGISTPGFMVGGKRIMCAGRISFDTRTRKAFELKVKMPRFKCPGCGKMNPYTFQCCPRCETNLQDYFELFAKRLAGRRKRMTKSMALDEHQAAEESQEGGRDE
jgi:hypothetical protein